MAKKIKGQKARNKDAVKKLKAENRKLTNPSKTVRRGRSR